VKARARGMGYQAKEAYNFTPYYVFATNVEDEEYGSPTGERMVAGVALKEYPPSHPAVPRKAMELLNIIRDHDK
jgi:hypothetical protein